MTFSNDFVHLYFEWCELSVTYRRSWSGWLIDCWEADKLREVDFRQSCAYSLCHYVWQNFMVNNRIYQRSEVFVHEE